MPIRYLSGLSVDSTVLVVDAANDRVGIGTASPSTKLEVGNFLDAVTNKITVAARYEYEPEFNFRLGQSGTNLDWIGAVISSGDDGNYNGKILFKTANAGRDTPTTKMVIKASGNVGIGTTSPAYKLDVVGESRFGSGSKAIVGTDGTYSSYSTIGFGGTTNGYNRVFGFDGTSDGLYLAAATGHGISFRVNGSGSDSMFINSSGNVGIGTTSPSQKLEVVGVTRLTDTNANPLELNRGLDVDSVGPAGVGMSFGTLKTGVYKPGAYIFGTLASNGTDGTFGIQTRGGDVLTTQLSITASGATTFSSSVTASSLIKSGGTASQYLMADGSVSTLTNPVTGTGTTNFVPKWTSGSVIGNSQTFDDGTNVGIGTASPTQKLEVNGVIESYYLEFKPVVFYDFNSDTTGEWSKGNSTLSVPNDSVTRYTSTGNDSNISKTFDFDGGQNQIIRIHYKVVTGPSGGGEIFYANSQHGFSASYFKGFTLVSDGAWHTLVLDMSNLNAGGTDWIDYNVTQIRFDLTNVTGVEIDIDWISIGGNGYGTQYFENDVAFMNGNVGIGTTAPGSRLEIAGTTGSYNSGIGFAASGTGARTYRTYISTDGGFNFDDATAGATRIKIDASGNVGIGTTAPGSRLTIGESFATVVGLTIDTGNGGDSAIVARKSASKPAFGVLPWDASVFLSAGVYYDGNAWQHHSNDNNNQLFALDPSTGVRWYASNDGTPNWNVSSNELLWDNSSIWKNLVRSTRAGDSYFTGGNVGIGITNPARLLDINGTTNFRDAFYFSNGGVGYTTWGTIDGALALNIQAASGYAINLGTNASTGRVVITSGGNVGIGTTAPTEILNISRVSTNNYIKVEAGGQAANYSGLMLTEYGINWGWALRHNAATDLLHISYQDNTPTFSDTVTFNRNGNVGIGTTSPASALEVIGSIRNKNASANANYSQFSTTESTLTVSTHSINAGAYPAPIIFSPNLSERMRITDAGNVGIGTTSPAYKLDVDGGPIRITNGFSEPTSEAGYRLKFADNGGINNDSGIGLSGSLGDESLWINKGSANGNIRFMFGTLGEKVTFTSGGNVGIGTTSPGYKLNVYESNTAESVSAKFQTAHPNLNYILLQNGGGSFNHYIQTNSGNLGLSADENGSSGVIQLRTNNVTAVTVDSSQNVGIGTTSPADILHVNKSGANTRMIVGNNAAYDQFIYFQGNNDWSIGIDNSNSNAFTLSNYSTIGTNDKLTVTTGGNVGIGTTAPGYKLDINGVTRFQDIVRFKTNAWNLSDEGNNRFFFSNSGRTYFGSGNGYEWRSSADTALAVITDGGNVGIGTTAPAYKLDVNGDVRAYKASGEVQSILRIGTTDFYAFHNDSAYGLYTTDYGSLFLRVKSTGLLNIYDKIYLASSGNVGIGTTAPSTRFQVNKGSSGNVASFTTETNTAGAYAGITLNSTTQGADDWYGSEIRSINVQGNPNFLNPRLAFFVQNTNTYLPADRGEKMTINGDGYVGIATSSPPIKLYVGTVLTGTNGNGTYASDAIAVNSSESITIGPDRRADWTLNATTTTSTTFQSKLNIWSDNEDHITFGGASTHLVSAWESFKIWINNDSADAGTLHLYHTSSKTEFVRLAGSGNNWINGGNVGIGTTNPIHKLEVGGNISINGGTFLDFANGDVRLVNGSGTLSIQTYSVSTGLTTKATVTGAGNVGIGTTAPTEKLHVDGSTLITYNNSFQSTNSVGNKAILARVSPTAGIVNYAEYATATNLNGFVIGSDDARVKGNIATDSLEFITNTSTRMTILSGGNVGINTTTPGSTLHVVGDVLIQTGALGVGVNPNATDGRIDASNDIVAFSTSDRRLKENITPIANALEKVKSLTGVEFDWKEETKSVHGYEGHDVGIIAQDVQAVLPEAVRTNDSGYLSVRYEKMIALLVEANKELADRVEQLEKLIK